MQQAMAPLWKNRWSSGDFDASLLDGRMLLGRMLVTFRQLAAKQERARKAGPEIPVTSLPLCPLFPWPP